MTEATAPIFFDNEHSHIKIVLTWRGNVDFDLSAFMLGEKGYIEDEADLVFYNSLSRNSSFEGHNYTDEEDWIASTVPVSADGSLVGSKDSVGLGESQVNESMVLELSKVSDKISKVVFCVSIFQGKLQSTPSLLAHKFELRIEEGDNLLSEYEIDFDNNVKAAEVYELTRLSSYRWVGRKIHIPYRSGLQEIMDKYV